MGRLGPGTSRPSGLTLGIARVHRPNERTSSMTNVVRMTDPPVDCARGRSYRCAAPRSVMVGGPTNAA